MNESGIGTALSLCIGVALGLWLATGSIYLALWGSGGMFVVTTVFAYLRAKGL